VRNAETRIPRDVKPRRTNGSSRPRDPARASGNLALLFRSPHASSPCFFRLQEKRLLTKKLKAEARESALGFALNFYDALTDQAAEISLPPYESVESSRTDLLPSHVISLLTEKGRREGRKAERKRERERENVLALANKISERVSRFCRLHSDGSGVASLLISRTCK